MREFADLHLTIIFSKVHLTSFGPRSFERRAMIKSRHFMALGNTLTCSVTFSKDRQLSSMRSGVLIADDVSESE
jgi:hypothetical protein